MAVIEEGDEWSGRLIELLTGMSYGSIYNHKIIKFLLKSIKKIVNIIPTEGLSDCFLEKVSQKFTNYCTLQKLTLIAAVKGVNVNRRQIYTHQYTWNLLMPRVSKNKTSSLQECCTKEYTGRIRGQ